MAENRQSEPLSFALRSDQTGPRGVRLSSSVPRPPGLRSGRLKQCQRSDCLVVRIHAHRFELLCASSRNLIGAATRSRRRAQIDRTQTHLYIRLSLFADVRLQSSLPQPDLVSQKVEKRHILFYYPRMAPIPIGFIVIVACPLPPSACDLLSGRGGACPVASRHAAGS